MRRTRSSASARLRTRRCSCWPTACSRSGACGRRAGSSRRSRRLAGPRPGIRDDRDPRTRAISACRDVGRRRRRILSRATTARSTPSTGCCSPVSWRPTPAARGPDLQRRAGAARGRHVRALEGDRTRADRRLGTRAVCRRRRPSAPAPRDTGSGARWASWSCARVVSAPGARSGWSACASRRRGRGARSRPCSRHRRERLPAGRVQCALRRRKPRRRALIGRRVADGVRLHAAGADVLLEQSGRVGDEPLAVVLLEQHAAVIGRSSRAHRGRCLAAP